MLLIKERKQSCDGSTKYLLEMNDGALVESLMFEYNGIQELCVSTQVGCSVGCVFCASARYGFRRNLSAEEIQAGVELVLRDNSGEVALDEVTLQGTGEPLSNFENVSVAARIILDKGFAKDVSLATSGNTTIIPLIRKTPIKKVYLSLHAVDDVTRISLMPGSLNSSVDVLIELIDDHARAVGLRAIVNYLLLSSINDTESHMKQLAILLKDRFLRLQLMELNSVQSEPSSCLRSSSNIYRCRSFLESAGLSVSILHSRGVDIAGGCGQMISMLS